MFVRDTIEIGAFEPCVNDLGYGVRGQHHAPENHFLGILIMRHGVFVGGAHGCFLLFLCARVVMRYGVGVVVPA